MVEEVGALYEQPGLPAGPERAPGELSPPGGGFVVLWEDGRALAGGGVKRLDERACEIKRMYVVPDARGRGHRAGGCSRRSRTSRAISATASRGSTPARSSRARSACTSARATSPMPDYNGNPYASFWGEKRLVER